MIRRRRIIIIIIITMVLMMIMTISTAPNPTYKAPSMCILKNGQLILETHTTE